jgi:glycosyltransferase involved in cell wall biosynthesis
MSADVAGSRSDTRSSAVAARLLFDVGPYPITDDAIGGIGLRLVELAGSLAERFDVTVLAPQSSGHVVAPAVDVRPQTDWADALTTSDAVFFFDMADRLRMEQAHAAGKLIITENAPPIEHLEYPSLKTPEAHFAVLDDYRRQLEISHHFLCRSSVERATLLANLRLVGRLTAQDVVLSRTVDHLVSLVPIGFSAASAKRASEAEPRPTGDILWTGGIWPFYRPVALVEAIALLRSRGVDRSVTFLYGQPHPDNAEVLAGLRAAIQRLGLSDRAIVREDLPSHTARDGLLRGAKALAVLASRGVENDTCVRLRIRDSRLYGLPTICDPFGPTATELQADGLGHLVDPDDVENLAVTIATVTAAQPRTDWPRAAYTYERTTASFVAWLSGALTHSRGERS